MGRGEEAAGSGERRIGQRAEGWGEMGVQAVGTGGCSRVRACSTLGQGLGCFQVRPFVCTRARLSAPPSEA